MFFRRCSTKRNSHQALLYQALLSACVLSSLLRASAAGVDKTKELQERFDRESNANSKVKILEKLGEAQFAAATQAQKESDYIYIGLIFEKYRDNVRTAFDLLKKQEPDSEKHSQGYRHLELQVRRGIREVEEIIIIVPEEVRPPMRIVREDLVHIDDELIHYLFPIHNKEKSAPPPTGEKP